MDIQWWIVGFSLFYETLNSRGDGHTQQPHYLRHCGAGNNAGDIFKNLLIKIKAMILTHKGQFLQAEIPQIQAKSLICDNFEKLSEHNYDS